MKSEIKLNSEHLFELAALEINAIFFGHCLNTTVCKFNNFNIGAVNTIQKKFIPLQKMGEQIRSLL